MRAMKQWGLVALMAAALWGCGDNNANNAEPPPCLDCPAQDAASDDASEEEDTAQEPQDVAEPEPDLPPEEEDTAAPDRDTAVEDEPAPVEPDPPVNTEAPLAEQNAWGPAGRVVGLDMPENAREARHGGCILHGKHVGTALSSLLLLAGGLDQFLLPDANDNIAVLLLAQAEGWQPGVGSIGLDSVDMHLFRGELGDGGVEDFWISPDSFVDSDPQMPPLTTFPDSEVIGSWIDTPASLFTVELPILGLAIVGLQLKHTRLTGQLFADGPGMGLTSGTLTGYIDSEGIAAIVEDLQEGCNAGNNDALCRTLSLIVPLDVPPTEAVDDVVQFVGGFDARLDNGFPYPCGDDDDEEACNAVGICLLVEMEGVEIQGPL